MRYPALVLITALAGVFPAAVTAQQSTVDEVDQAVKDAYPAEMRPLPPPPGAPAFQQRSCSAVYNRAGDGAPKLIAAAYTNGVSGRVVMLSYSKGPAGKGVANALAEITDRDLYFLGERCEVSIVDLADPASSSSPLKNTIKVSFEGADWFFLWNGTQLVSIGAVQQEFGADQPPYTALSQTQIVDVERSGARQIVSVNGDSDQLPRDDGIAATATRTLFRFNGTRYAATRTFHFWASFDAQPGAPSTWKQSIVLRSPAASYKLIVVNGSRKGTDRVSSARVVLNGQDVIAGSEVNLATDTLSKTVTLAAQNTIQMTVSGKAGSTVYVMVEPQQ